VRSCLTLRT
jgi:hypothetical protein